MNPHLLPFVSIKLYKSVEATLKAIHEGSKQSSDLVSIAQKFIKEGQKFFTSKPQYNFRYAFRMALWLATYYNFYLKSKESPVLYKIVASKEMSDYLQEDGYTRLIQCFLHPSRMLQFTNSLTDDQVDPISQLFSPISPNHMNPSDVNLRHSLANLMAVVLGSPPRSNHLWFHMFEADKLQNSYMTGFMYDAVVSPDGLLYDHGVEFSPQGQFDRQEYKKHACRGTYTLHSLYLLLWANFGCFCMSLLTQPDAEQNICGTIFSRNLSIRHYCMSKLKALWMHIQDNLKLSEEQRTNLVTVALDKALKLFSTTNPSAMGSITHDTPRGIFVTHEDLDDYEESWHTKIYQPAWQETTKFVCQKKSELFKMIRNLEMIYPKFPSEQELIHFIQSSGDLSELEDGKLRSLSLFTMDYPLLYTGGILLPDLVEFYQWLQTFIANSVTYNDASSTTIGQLIDQAENSNHGDHIRKLYKRVKLNYNHYIELTGGYTETAAARAHVFSDDTPLLHFLTDAKEERRENNWLYIIIADIINNHNQTIVSFCAVVEANRHMFLGRLLPENPSKILPTEVDLRSAIVNNSTQLHGISSYLQLIRRRYHINTHTFQLEQLEEDFVSEFIAGNSFIMLPNDFGEGIKFKKDLMCTIHDLQDDLSKLHDSFKEPDLSDDLKKSFEYEFHSISYHLLVEVLAALRTIMGHLIKAMEESEKNLEDKTILNFMLSRYEHSLNESDVLHNFGIQSASLSHLHCLFNAPLTCTYACFRFFFFWVDEGFYDFNTLPFHLKRHLDSKDQVAIEELCAKWNGATSELVKGVQQLIDVLKHSEQDIASCVNETDKPIVDYLLENHDDLQQECKNLITNYAYIPQSIVLHHYVELRLSLRRLQQREEMGNYSDITSVVTEKWQEFVEDLWDRHLPELREELRGEGIYAFIEYGFPEEEADGKAFAEKITFTARKFTSDEIATFLINMKLPQYAETFRSEDITGDMLLTADTEMLIELGVSDPLHQLKIMQFIRKDLQGNPGKESSSKHSADDIAEFLASIGFPQYADAFKDCSISGDMLLEASPEVLAALGVASSLHQMKIMQLFRREVQGTVVQYSNQHLSQFLHHNKLDKYVAALDDAGIDGDMILEVEEKLLLSVLKEVGMSSLDARKIRPKYKTYTSH